MAMIKVPKSYFGDGEGYYYYSDKIAKRIQEKKFLGSDDAIEIAINRQLAKERRLREKLKKMAGF